MRVRKVAIIIGSFFCLGLLAFGLWLPSRSVVPVIMYHHIAETDTFKAHTTSPERFQWHMDYLKEKGYHVLSSQELIEGIQSGRKFPRKSVAITFDDGYENNYLNAFPVLKNHGFPAIIFMVADLVGQKGYLSWAQIREMEPHGVIVGSHTLNHPYLPDLSEKEQTRQIQQSRRILEEGLGHPVYYFAYPSGGFSESIKDIVRDAGYQGAYTTNRGYDPQNKDVYELNRVRFSDKDNTKAILWAKLSGYYNLFRKTKDPY